MMTQDLHTDHVLKTILHLVLQEYHFWWQYISHPSAPHRKFCGTTAG